MRVELPLDYATVSVAWEAPGFNNMKEGLATSILSDVIDNSVNMRIKWNNGEFELIKRAVTDAKVHESSVAGAIYNSYSDMGLLGFTVMGSPGVLDKAVRGVHDYFANIGKNGVSNKDFDVTKFVFNCHSFNQLCYIVIINTHPNPLKMGGNLILAPQKFM